ncbi:MAG: hypothetical protein ACPGVO_19835 [Spirulinaceae cyanobacterium]
MDSEFLCLKCGFHDTGNYCSSCGAELRVQPDSLHILISKRFEEIGFLEFESVPSLDKAIFLSSSTVEEIVDRSKNTLFSEEFVAGSSIIQFVFLVEVDDQSSQNYLKISNDLFSQLSQREAELKESGIRNISLIVVFIYKTSPMMYLVETVQRNTKREIGPFFNISLQSVAIVIPECNLFTSRFSLHSSLFKSALKQIDVPSNINLEQSNTPAKSLNEYLSLLIEPFQDYWIGCSRLSRPGFLVKLIESESISLLKSLDLIKYILGSVFTASIIAIFLDVDVIGFGIPVIDETFNVFAFIFGGFITAVMFHLPLRLAGGTGKFKHSVTASAYINITFYPLIILLEGIYSLFSSGESMPSSYGHGATVMYYCTLLSEIHKISYGKTYLVFALTTLMFVIFGAFFVAMILQIIGF